MALRERENSSVSFYGQQVHHNVPPASKDEMNSSRGKTNKPPKAKSRAAMLKVKHQNLFKVIRNNELLVETMHNEHVTSVWKNWNESHLTLFSPQLNKVELNAFTRNENTNVKLSLPTYRDDQKSQIDQSHGHVKRIKQHNLLWSGLNV